MFIADKSQMKFLKKRLREIGARADNLPRCPGPDHYKADTMFLFEVINVMAESLRDQFPHVHTEEMRQILEREER